MTPTGDAAPGNPYGNRTWSMGHRNVEGITFDARGNLWASEFGEKETDELDRIVRRRPTTAGRGSRAATGSGGYRDPFAEWSPTSICSPAGVAVARGRAWLGALRGQCLYSVRLTGDNAGRKRRHFAGRFGRIRAVADGARTARCGSPRPTATAAASPGSTDDRVIRIALG